TDAVAAAFGLLEHLLLFVGEGAAVLLQNHPDVAPDDGDGCTQLMHGQRHCAWKTVVFGWRSYGFDDAPAPAFDAGASSRRHTNMPRSAEYLGCRGEAAYNDAYADTKSARF